MGNDSWFDILILNARPAAGKSEIIHYLKATPLDERLARFHVGEIHEIDDFPMLWTWFEEDDLLELIGQARLHSTRDGYFLWPHLWNLLIRRISLDYSKFVRDYPATQPVTTLIEFSRGAEHGGYKEAYQHLADEILRKAAILYVEVSFAESFRKNRRRFNPNRPDSILEHGLSDDKMRLLYGETDWDALTGGERRGSLEIDGIKVPFAVFENEDDVTTAGGPALGARLEHVLGDLWRLKQVNRQG